MTEGWLPGKDYVGLGTCIPQIEQGPNFLFDTVNELLYRSFLPKGLDIL